MPYEAVNKMDVFSAQVYGIELMLFTLNLNMNGMILCIFRYSVKMAYTYSLKYQQNLVTGHRPGSGNFRWSKRHGRSTKMCHDFTINDSEGITLNNVLLFAVKEGGMAVWPSH